MLLDEIALSERPALSEERAEFRRLYLAGRFPEARRLAEACYAAGGERVAWVNNLILVAIAQGNLREAYSLYVTNADRLDSCDDLYAAGNFNLSGGLASKRLGELHKSEVFFDRAAIAYTAAADCFERAGAQAGFGYAENALANLKIVAGEAADAFEHIDRAQLLFNDAFEVARAAQCEDTRALAFEALDLFVEAFECSARAVVTLERCGPAEAAALGQARETLARVYRKMTGRGLEAEVDEVSR